MRTPSFLTGPWPARLVAAMMAAAAVLAFAMASTSAINDRPDLWRGPPDEYGHRSAARYYMDHWLPPKAGDPQTLDSYSRDYGFSYLNDTDPAYFFAGKFAHVVGALTGDPERALRYFNVALLAILALLCALRPAAWLLFVPLVITPQVWYIFSYFNGDAFALFLSVLVAYQVCAPRTALSRYLDGPLGWRAVAGAIGIAAMLALLLLAKKNYLAFVAFVPAVVALTRLGAAAGALLGAAAVAFATAYLGWFTVPREWAQAAGAAGALALVAAIFLPRATRRVRAATVAKLAALAALAVAAALPRYFWDAVVNGSFEKQRAEIIQLQEQFAKPAYKPSVIYYFNPKVFYGIEMRARGVPLSALFEPPWLWHSKTFATATGTYGWIEFAAGKPYFVTLALLYAAIGGLYAWAALRSSPRAGALVGLALATGFSALTVAVALFHSWSHDFQAQGRYLFPIAAIAGAAFLLCRDRMPSRALTALICACFAISAWSFVFIGLAQVPRQF